MIYGGVMGRWRRGSWLTAASGLLLAAAANPATFRGGDEPSVAAHEVVEDDVYLFGETVTVDGTVLGDVIACGRVVTLNGRAEGDFVACGQAVVVNGSVGDDVRVAGQVLKFETGSEVGGDVLVAGFSIETAPRSSIGQDFIVAGYQAKLAGSVGRNLDVEAAAVELLGSVEGRVEVEAGSEADAFPARFLPQPPIAPPTVALGFTLADSARIGGDLTYAAPGEGNIAAAAQVGGETSWRPLEASSAALPGTWDHVVERLGRLAALLLVGGVLLWLAPGWLDRLAQRVRSRPLPSLGWGVAGVLAAGVGVLALFLVALLVAMLVNLVALGDLVPLVVGFAILAEVAWILALWIGLVYLAQIVLGRITGKWLLGVCGIAWDSRLLHVLEMGVGLVLLTLLTAVPYLGPVVGIVIALMGFGAACTLVLRRPA